MVALWNNQSLWNLPCDDIDDEKDQISLFTNELNERKKENIGCDER